ncbi:Imm1 family immunity protein [Solirubrobacter soli]|uniref:Imm1 family immunity protein n=1 Tax=Solirubrobacter soli TaxID=363832 RepID=UPI00040ECCF7|nr:Imm1 family immunity protein [Solirubrobacter soli]
MKVEWACAWASPQALDIESPGALERLLADVQHRAVGSGIATAAVIHRGDATFSVVLGLGEVAFVQWMGGGEGAYLTVETGADDDDLSDLVAFSYLGHHTEVPRRQCVRRQDAIEEAKHFLARGRLSQRWEWSGYLGDTPAPPGARIRHS